MQHSIRLGIPLSVVRLVGPGHPTVFLISLGLISLGLISLGLISLGLISLGLISLGLISLGLRSTAFFIWRVRRIKILDGHVAHHRLARHGNVLNAGDVTK